MRLQQRPQPLEVADMLKVLAYILIAPLAVVAGILSLAFKS
jgi:hypothetical protein